MMSKKTNIDLGKLGEQFGVMFRKLRPKVEAQVETPAMRPLYENLQEALQHEFGDSLTKKDMLDLLTYYLVMSPVHQAIYSL